MDTHKEKLFEVYKEDDVVNYLNNAFADLKMPKLQMKKIVQAYNEWIRTLLLLGNDVEIGKVGTLYLEHKKERPETQRRCFGEVMTIKRRPSTNILKFKPSRSIKIEIKEKFDNNAVDIKRYRNKADIYSYYDDIIEDIGEQDG